MNDPVPNQGESGGTPVSATLPLPSPENTVSLPQSESLTASDPSPLRSQPSKETAAVGVPRGHQEASIETPAATTLSRFCGQGYVSWLQRRGFEIIGHGGAADVRLALSLVLAKPGADAVIKVGVEPYADPWPHYAAWCLRNPGPFRPTVRTLRWHGREGSPFRFFVATMDRLHTPLDLYAKVSSPSDVSPWQLEQLWKGQPVAMPLIEAVQGWYGMLDEEGIPKGRGGLPEALCAKLSHRLAKRLRKVGLRDVATFIETLARTLPGHTPDPQQQNWMFTAAGGLVLVDPFTRCRRPLPETAPRLVMAAA